MGANDSHQSGYPDGLLGDFSATDLPIGSSEAQRQTATCITRKANEVEYDSISDYTRCAKKSMKEDHEYTIDYIVRHLGKRANKQYVMKWYGYTTDHEPMEPSASTSTHLIEMSGVK